jgi:Ankyrin repeats (3 copies)/Ankyrin repeats (many copies)
MNRLSKVTIIMVLPLVVICWHHIYRGHRYLDSKFIEVTRIGDYLGVDGYLNKGADVNCRDKDGLTPLIWAAIQGHEEIVRLLLERGGDLEAKNNNGDTALMWASVMGHRGVVELLLDHGANADLAEAGSGVTALMAAAAEGYADVAQVLTEKGAAINAKDRNGNTALTHASVRGHSNVVDLLLAEGATFNGARPSAVATAVIFVTDDGRPAGMDIWRLGPNGGGRIGSYPQIPVTDAVLREMPQTEDRCFTASATSEVRVVPTVFITTVKPKVFSTH